MLRFRQLDRTQYQEVMRRLWAEHPELGRNAQSVNAGGQFVIKPVRGGTLPATLTAEQVQSVIVETQSSNDSALWADAQAIQFGRRNR